MDGSIDNQTPQQHCSDESPSKIVLESPDHPDLHVFDYLLVDSDEEELEEDDEDWIQKQCNSMLEIFAIVYLGRDDVEPQNQLGRIYMHTPVGILDIYNVDKVDETRETIELGDEFDIKDIKGPVPFHNECSSLEFDLFCAAYKGSVYDIFRNMQFISRHDAYLNNISLDRIDGTGKVIILTGLYAHATVARVVVRLNTSVAANLYGTVSACNTQFDSPSATSILFFKEEEEEEDERQIIVGTDGLIPLSRSRVAVPFDSELYLDISLVVDDKLLVTTMSFSARKVGVLTKTFKSLSVTVHWEALYYQSNKGGE